MLKKTLGGDYENTTRHSDWPIAHSGGYFFQGYNDTTGTRIC